MGTYGAPPTLPWSPPPGSTHGEDEEDKDKKKKKKVKPFVFGTGKRIIDLPETGADTPGVGKGTSGGQPPTGGGGGATIRFSKAGSSGGTSRRKAAYGSDVLTNQKRGMPMRMRKRERGIGDHARRAGSKYIVLPLMLPPLYALMAVYPKTGRGGGGMDLSPLIYGGGLTLLSVFAIYPALAKLVAPKASYGKRLAGSTAVAVAAGNLLRATTGWEW